jgi:tRNA(fMet)-specific endonuclease VapC
LTHMLDTNVCIDVIRNRSQLVRERLKSHPVDAIAISTITLSELNHGVSKSHDSETNHLALIEFLIPFAVLPYDDGAAKAYGQIRAMLERQGTPIGPMDLLIGAHAFSQGLILVTNNEKEFLRIPGLVVENWTTP